MSKIPLDIPIVVDLENGRPIGLTVAGLHMRNVARIAYSGNDELTVTLVGDIRFREKQKVMHIDSPTKIDVDKIQKALAEKLKEAITIY